MYSPALQLLIMILSPSGVRLQTRALAGSQDWEALDAYSQERKLPTPLETFVTVAKTHNAPKPVLARYACCCQPPDCTGLCYFPVCSAWTRYKETTLSLGVYNCLKG